MPTPDERRATWIEPGLSRLRDEQDVVTGVAIDIRRAEAYQGNGIMLAFDGPISTGRPVLVLSAAAIRRLYRQLPQE